MTVNNNVTHVPQPTTDKKHSSHLTNQDQLQITYAMRLLHAGVDITVITLWLGHENVTTTQIYLQADMALKQRALDRTATPTTPPGRYKPADQLLAFLEAL